MEVNVQPDQGSQIPRIRPVLRTKEWQRLRRCACSGGPLEDVLTPNLISLCDSLT